MEYIAILQEKDTGRELVRVTTTAEPSRAAIAFLEGIANAPKPRRTRSDAGKPRTPVAGTEGAQ